MIYMKGLDEPLRTTVYLLLPMKFLGSFGKKRKKAKELKKESPKGAKEKRLSEKQVKFLIEILEEAHRRYVNKADPPESVMKYLRIHLEALKEELWGILREEGEQ